VVVLLDIMLGISSVLLVILVLLHRGKGGGLSSLFGGGVSSSLGGSAVVEKNLDRLTYICAAVWTVSIIALGLLLKNDGG
jgi:preprotein translocase subunit SecG